MSVLFLSWTVKSKSTKMCGIFCILNHINENHTYSNFTEISEWALCKDVIAARGPDCFNTAEDFSEKWHAKFYASVLWMQGLKPVSQPLLDNNRNILLWNGDIFSGNMFKNNVCDSEVILSALEISVDIPSTLNKIRGPFSIIYYQKSSKRLYFARDKFGRHSLLIKISENCESILLTSVATKDVNNIMELPAIGIFIADIFNKKVELTCIPWFKLNQRRLELLNNMKNIFKIHLNIKETFCSKIEKLSFHKIPSPEDGFLKYMKNINENQSVDQIMETLLLEKSINETVNNLLELLNESVRRRVKVIPNFCRNCTKLSLENITSCQHAKIGLLFSGGLDSAILATIAHNNIEIEETIDLINVAFKKKNKSNYEVPDRITGRQTFKELLKICPGRKFNFVEVDISQEELERYRSTRISDLTYPCVTVLDESLACAVWFASKGSGILYPAKQLYESSSRVLLLGMGADEQFGGYMRHRTVLKRKGWGALSEDLELEFDRISERNLGRDNRMVSDHGRQPRLPYLDEDLVNFIQKLPPWERCCPVEKLPPGLGDKLLLRLLAKKIKLCQAAKFPKRAFQFGSRIADGKENAKDLSKHL